MKNRNADFDFVDIADNYILINDIGNHKEVMSITNDPESVLQRLTGAAEDILKGRRLFYIDTNGRVDELLYNESGKFVTYNPGYNTIIHFNADKHNIKID